VGGVFSCFLSETVGKTRNRKGYCAEKGTKAKIKQKPDVGMRITPFALTGWYEQSGEARPTDRMYCLLEACVKKKVRFPCMLICVCAPPLWCGRSSR
jgi:hypothetical protein